MIKPSLNQQNNNQRLSVSHQSAKRNIWLLLRWFVYIPPNLKTEEQEFLRCSKNINLMKKFPIYYNMDYPDTTWKVFFGSVYINTIPRSNNTDNNEASLLTFRRLKAFFFCTDIVFTLRRRSVAIWLIEYPLSNNWITFSSAILKPPVCLNSIQIEQVVLFPNQS